MTEFNRLGLDDWEPDHVREEREAAARKARQDEDNLSRLLQSANDARAALLETRMRLFIDGYDEFGRLRVPTPADPVDPMVDYAGLFGALAALRQREQNRIDCDEMMARLDLVYLRATARGNYHAAIRTVELQAKLSGLLPGRMTKAEARLLAEAEASAPSSAPAPVAPDHAATASPPSDAAPPPDPVAPLQQAERGTETASAADGTAPPARTPCQNDSLGEASGLATPPCDTDAPAMPPRTQGSKAALPPSFAPDPGYPASADSLESARPGTPPGPGGSGLDSAWPRYGPPGR
ncbi:MAG: hypothetical protein AB7G39_15385 [Alphaproteobacteria bacterium]